MFLATMQSKDAVLEGESFGLNFIEKRKLFILTIGTMLEFRGIRKSFNKIEVIKS